MHVMTTKEILAESFRELAEKKNVDKITIREITSNCGMVPATFYRHFQNKYDMIVSNYSAQMHQIMEQAIGEKQSWNELQMSFIRFYADNKSLFINILRNISGYDLFNHDMLNVSVQMIHYYLREVEGIDSVDPDLDMYIHIHSNCSAMIICEWLLGVINVEPEKLVEILNNSMNRPLADLIFK